MMANQQASPISQLLNSMGITREELNMRTNQMRQFLTTDSAFSSRVSSHDSASMASSGSKIRSNSVSTTSMTTSSRSFSRASSTSLRDASPPPSTPVKSEPTDVPMPARQYDSMEIVIERQRLARKEKKERRGRRDRAAPPSPSPSASRGSASADPARDDPSEDSGASTSTSARQSPPPLTPQQSKYYRAHTAAQSLNGPTRTESPTPTRSAAALIPLPNLHYYYPQYAPPPKATAEVARLKAPVTPSPVRIIKPPSSRPSPLPPSSPPPTSSPPSSPVRGVINLVSSPGPMGPQPREEEYDGLPYTLPPGPYSPTKPECSYAAILGQAILSSPDRRLTLQEIYDWITIVYPYFKRGETTWMNSIRHVLSTTVVFRKVTRERALGRTQWAIWDQDLACFKGGGFKKQLCNDMKVKDRPGPIAGNKRARPKLEDTAEADRKAKKPRNTKAAPQPLPSTTHPIFPPSRPTPHHQSYYDSCLPQTLPAEVLFPPLPASSGYRQLTDNSTKQGSVRTASADPQAEDEDHDPSSPITHKWTPPAHLTSAASTSSVMSSVPSLTPNDSSSSPPVSTSDIEMDGTINVKNLHSAVNVADPARDDVDELDGDQFDDVFAAPKLNPVQFWGEAPAEEHDSLQPGIQLKYAAPAMLMASDDEDDEPLVKVKGRRQKKVKSKAPASPTLGLRSNPLRASTRASKGKGRLRSPPPIDDAVARPTTPPPKPFLSSCLSPIRTPISHQGLYMSPTTSLAHYKSNLNPPPVASYSILEDDEEPDALRTPSKKRTVSSGSGPPVTPRKLFPFLSGDSPFRTPGSMSSPFRGMFDPHDPSSLLDEELNRLSSAGHGDSPAGLFGRSRAQLLYDSPGQSPGKMTRWW